MTAPKQGDRVRVVLEGTVDRVYGTGEFDVGGVAGNTIVPNAPHVVSVEVLPPPEPEWQLGDVVRDAHSQVFRRAFGERWHSFDGHSLADNHPARPLTRLVPEERS